MRTRLVDVADAMTRYDTVIGLEVHVELGTETKMFCGCATEFGGEPNTRICPVCLGLPGSLPVVNAAAIESTIRMGLALNCSIAPVCRFARKNYFYPDMPKDYQISQYDEPLCVDGHLDVEVPTDAGVRTFRVEIERVHMEEDTGKLTHAGGVTGRIQGADYSLVDYNRAGIPLVEIVTKPVPGTKELAPAVGRAYVTAVRDIMRSLGVSDVRMEQGSLRCDANISLAPPGRPWGRRTETKNVNSLRSVERALTYEIQRQGGILDAGGTVKQETRHFHEGDGTTTSGRSKEEAEDYRYFPEPDLMPVEASVELVERLRATLPELPAAKRHRLQDQWGISDFDMQSVINAGAVDLVVATTRAGVDQASARKWWMGELARLAKGRGEELTDLPVEPSHIARVEELITSGTLNDKLARQVFAGIVAGEGDVDVVVRARGLELVSDDSALLVALDDAIAAMPQVVEKIRGGKAQAAGAIIGAVMKATRGQADAGRVRELLLERIAG